MIHLNDKVDLIHMSITHTHGEIHINTHTNIPVNIPTNVHTESLVSVPDCGFHTDQRIRLSQSNELEYQRTR